LIDRSIDRLMIDFCVGSNILAFFTKLREFLLYAMQ